MLKNYAIRFGEHVEFRVATEKPKAFVSTYTNPVKTKENVLYNVDQYGYAQYKTVEKTSKLTLKQTFYSGGKVIGVCKYTHWALKTGQAIPKDGCIEVSRELRNAALGKPVKVKQVVKKAQRAQWEPNW